MFVLIRFRVAVRIEREDTGIAHGTVLGTEKAPKMLVIITVIIIIIIQIIDKEFLLFQIASGSPMAYHFLNSSSFDVLIFPKEP